MADINFPSSHQHKSNITLAHVFILKNENTFVWYSHDFREFAAINTLFWFALHLHELECCTCDSVCCSDDTCTITGACYSFFTSDYNLFYFTDESSFIAKSRLIIQHLISMFGSIKVIYFRTQFTEVSLTWLSENECLKSTHTGKHNAVVGLRLVEFKSRQGFCLWRHAFLCVVCTTSRLLVCMVNYITGAYYGVSEAKNWSRTSWFRLYWKK